MFPALLAAAALVVMPLAALAEHHLPRLWANRLALPEYAGEPNRHTPRSVDGTYLPARLTGTHHYDNTDSPLIIAGPTAIEAGATVTIEAGVLVVVHEFAGLINHGRLDVQGTALDPVVFASNEVHPENQTWNGIITQTGGHTAAAHLWVQHASPALTCHTGSVVQVRSARIENGSIGVYQASTNCIIADSDISNVRDGIVAINAAPTAPNTTIRAREHTIRELSPESLRQGGAQAL